MSAEAMRARVRELSARLRAEGHDLAGAMIAAYVQALAEARREVNLIS